MVRLIVLVLFLLLSLLAVVRAPTYHLWMTAILVTEFPWIWIGATTLLLIWGKWVDKYAMVGTLVGVAAMVLFLSPVVRALAISARLGRELKGAFGPSGPDDSTAPLQLTQMLTGINAPQANYTTLTYSTADGAPLTLDYYKAQHPEPRPCVIVVHGGSWAGGDSRQLPELNTVLAKAGYNVATINYRLAPKYKSPAAVDDVHAAMQYLRQHAAELAIDTEQFVLLGRSAGAQITLTAAYTWHDPAVRGVVSFYGPADMVWGYSLPANPLVFDSRKVMIDYLGGTYEEVPQQYVNSSAIEFVTPTSPATLLIHGPLDPLVHYDHSVRLSAKLTENKVPYYFLSLPWGTHGCDYTLNGPGGQLSTYSVLRFLKVVCR